MPAPSHYRFDALKYLSAAVTLKTNSGVTASIHLGEDARGRVTNHAQRATTQVHTSRRIRVIGRALEPSSLKQIRSRGRVAGDRIAHCSSRSLSRKSTTATSPLKKKRVSRSRGSVLSVREDFYVSETPSCCESLIQFELITAREANKHAAAFRQRESAARRVERGDGVGGASPLPTLGAWKSTLFPKFGCGKSYYGAFNLNPVVF